MNTDALINELVEVTIKDGDFLKIKETLERIGIASDKKQSLYQTCHILHKRGKYYITHFKEMFQLDGKPVDYTSEDKARRNTIIDLLKEWDLVKVVDEKKIEDQMSLRTIKIVPFKEKSNWTFVSKYTVGKKRA